MNLRSLLLIVLALVMVGGTVFFAKNWLESQRVTLSDLEPAKPPEQLSEGELLAHMRAFGYTAETMQFMLLPLIRELRDPVGSMGNDSTLACLSDRPRMIYDYFKQLFAQVTNPPIDSIREEIIMSLECYVGPEGNLLETQETDAHRLRLRHPMPLPAALFPALCKCRVASLA